METIEERLLDFTDNPPFKIGQSEEEILEMLGPPESEWGLWFSYLKYGIIVGFDHNFEVDEITFTTMEGGTTYAGQVLGVKIGDPITLCEELWGESIFKRGRCGFHTSYWPIANELMIAVEHWYENGDEEGFGKYSMGDVKQIKIWRPDDD